MSEPIDKIDNVEALKEREEASGNEVEDATGSKTPMPYPGTLTQDPQRRVNPATGVTSGRILVEFDCRRLETTVRGAPGGHFDNERHREVMGKGARVQFNLDSNPDEHGNRSDGTRAGFMLFTRKVVWGAAVHDSDPRWRQGMFPK